MLFNFFSSHPNSVLNFGFTGVIGCFVFLTSNSIQAQNDSIKAAEQLKEVVVSGQYNPQSVDKSVFQVKVITRSQIDRQAGNNLADILNQTLNLSVTPNASTGKSGVSLFGLDASYFKILVDNVPLINDQDLGSNTDLTQILLDDVQQIEIVEGAMGVDYGANAVAGIINIITKKRSAKSWEITPYIQEESIGNEYNGISKGRHIQSVRVAKNFNEKWHANVQFTHNKFDGFLNNNKGKYHIQNDSLRGYEWLPKQQINAKAYVGYSPNKNHRFFYRMEYFDEVTNYYNPRVFSGYHVPTATYNEYAQDRDYATKRLVNLFNAAGSFESGLTYDFYLSYQQQKRNARNYTFFLRTDEEITNQDYEYESRKVYYSKGSLSNFFKKGIFDFQLGYEINQINGYASEFAYEYVDEPVKRNLGSYDVFASAEIKATPKFTLRPGARALFSSQFDTQMALSLSTLYDIGHGYEWRTVVGSSPRMPDYGELYSYFVDVNHNVQGNPDLKPENGLSVFTHLNKEFECGKWKFDSKLSFWYIDIQDRIEMVQIQSAPPAFRYENIDLYKTKGGSFLINMQNGRWSINTGFTYAGTSKSNGSQSLQNDDYLYSCNWNGNVAYSVPSWNTTFSIFAKYNGPQYQFVEQYNDAGESVLFRGKMSDYSLVDATVRKSFYNNKFEVTLGARNLLDVTQLNTTANAGVGHNAAAVSQLMGYGRSYFVKFLYRFQFD